MEIETPSLFWKFYGKPILFGTFIYQESEFNQKEMQQLVEGHEKLASQLEELKQKVCYCNATLSVLRACLYDPGVPGHCTGMSGYPRRISSRVYMISVHRGMSRMTEMCLFR